MSDIEEKFAGLNLVRNLGGASGLSASAIDMLKGGVFGFDESMRLASAAGRNLIADPYGAINSARDFPSVSGAMASAADALKGAAGFDESVSLTGAIGRNTIADPYGALNSARDFAGACGAVASAADALKGAAGFDESMRLTGAIGQNSVGDPYGALNSARDFTGAGDAMVSAVDAFKRVHGFDESLRLTSAAADPAMSKIARQISDQQNAIASLRPLIPEMPERFVDQEVVRIPELHLQPNPILETNKRLASIEQRFNRMESIALNGAEIATGLQASAATFLLKFEKASANNDRTSGRAIWLGIAAILIAVAMTGIQILYTELWRAPADSASQQAAIMDLKGQIKDIENTQRAAAVELAKVLTSSNSELTTTLRDIRNLLAEQQKRPVAAPETKR